MLDERGTEAAAATVFLVRATSAPPPGTPLVFDHPFVFFIRDVETKATLFVGQYAVPDQLVEAGHPDAVRCGLRLGAFFTVSQPALEAVGRPILGERLHDADGIEKLTLHGGTWRWHGDGIVKHRIE